MQSDHWFWFICYLGLYFVGLLLLDASYRAHIRDLNELHNRELDELHNRIATLQRSKKCLQSELWARQANGTPLGAEYIAVKALPTSEEWDEEQ